MPETRRGGAAPSRGPLQEASGLPGRQRPWGGGGAGGATGEEAEGALQAPHLGDGCLAGVQQGPAWPAGPAGGCQGPCSGPG